MKHLLEVGKSICKLSFERHYINIRFDGSRQVFHCHISVGRTVCFISKQLGTQRGERIPIARKTVYLTLRNTSKHGSINVILFRCFRRIYITRNVQIVAILANLVTAHHAREALNGFAVANAVGNATHIAGTELIALAILHKALAGIDNQHVVVVTMLFEHHDKRRNTRAKEDVSRQTNNCINVIALNQVATNLTFTIGIFQCIATEKYAMRQHNGEDTIRLQVMKLM